MKNNELHHFGKKGMKWGVRNTLQRIGDRHREKKEVNRIVKETMRDKTNKQSFKEFRKENGTNFLLNSLLYTPLGAMAIRRDENPKHTAKKISRVIAKKLVKTKSKEKYEAYVNKSNSFAIKKVRPKKKKKK